MCELRISPRRVKPAAVPSARGSAALALAFLLSALALAAPAQKSPPRPAVDVTTLDIAAFIREVASSERANNRNFADYTYTSKTTERETKDGRVVKERVTVAEVYPQYGESVRKVLSRDGVRLSEE